MAGFVQEEELIEDSENQRNIDMSELKNLLLWSHHTPHAHNDKMWAATADCTLLKAAPALIEKRRGSSSESSESSRETTAVN